MYGLETKRGETNWKFCVQTTGSEVLHVPMLSVGKVSWRRWWMIEICYWNICRMTLAGENRRTCRKSILSTNISTLRGLGSKGTPPAHQRPVALGVRCRRNDELGRNRRTRECGLGPRGWGEGSFVPVHTAGSTGMHRAVFLNLCETGAR